MHRLALVRQTHSLFQQKGRGLSGFVIPILCPFDGIVFNVFPDLAVIVFVADDMLVVGTLPELCAAPAICKALEREISLGSVSSVGAGVPDGPLYSL